MDNTVKIDIGALESERLAVISTYKKQLEAFRYIKKELEKVRWADSKYDELIEKMNVIGRTLSEVLQKLTNGDDVYVIGDTIDFANQYLENEKRFPSL